MFSPFPVHPQTHANSLYTDGRCARHSQVNDESSPACGLPRETRFYDPDRLSARENVAVSEVALGGLLNKRRTNMATIGTFTKDGAGFAGTIQTLTLNAKVTFEPQEKRSDNAPDYRVFHITDGFTSEIGAAWKKTSKENAEYLSVSLDDPSFPEKINARLVKTGSEQGHTLFWERARPNNGR
jgi:uncharacterized protein (DUF736 family)